MVLIMDVILLIVHGVEVEHHGQLVHQGRMRQQIAGELVDRELMEGLVAIEGADHPISPMGHVTG